MTASGQSPACWPSYIVSDSDRTKKGLIIIIIIIMYLVSSRYI
jgi:hypothetical protein